MVGWSRAEIVDHVVAALEDRARADDLEQVVYGFDHLDELGLHPLLHSGLRKAGWGVHPEQRYPGDRGKRSKAEGQRCDIVLTPDGRPLQEPDIAQTLFDPLDAAPLSRAYWLEVKSVAQYETSGPFRRYSAELLSSVSQDVKKLWADDGVRFGGLLLLLFTETPEVAEHDLAAWHRRCMERGLPVTPPAIRGVRLTDRIGNSWCAAALFGVRGG